MSMAKLFTVLSSVTPLGRFAVAVLMSKPVAVGRIVPVARKVALPFTARLIKALILPEPFPV